MGIGRHRLGTNCSHVASHSKCILNSNSKLTLKPFTTRGPTYGRTCPVSLPVCLPMSLPVSLPVSMPVSLLMSLPVSLPTDIHRIVHFPMQNESAQAINGTTQVDRIPSDAHNPSGTTGIVQLACIHACRRRFEFKRISHYRFDA